MRRAPTRPAVAVVVTITAVLAFAGLGRAAAPGAWDIAKDPMARERWTLHVRVERLLHPAEADDVAWSTQKRDEELRLEIARAMLEEADAASSPDMRLRFDLGIVYGELAAVQGRKDLYLRVVNLLAPALEMAPTHPAATHALHVLGIAYASLGRVREELETWRLYFQHLDSKSSAVAEMMNMGEAEMALGRLDDALDTFRAVLRLCGPLPNSIARNETYALTMWDLAVALDRSGDAHTATDTAARARQLSWGVPRPLGGPRTTTNGWVDIVTGWDAIRDEEHVFFVPDWEREWYLALGYAAVARDAHDSAQAAALWGAAEDHWGTYVTRSVSSAKSDRWLAIARLRCDRAHAERVKAEKHEAGEKAARAPGSPTENLRKF